MYLRIWAYDVPPGAVGRFVAAYGADGDWARLFARAAGFAGTELFGGTEVGTRFLTVDRWRDEAAWAAFLERWGEDYRALDVALAPLTSRQELLLEGASP
ncbi:Antibiotic biosynthesis monooxygenase [Geodermatophilus saharensis]|uniref:Antibiotic biosynthesis monooxygenase n=1 Tax=Geodermatophilus saharensis TaxID=1137994 RepID=A0A239J718_9ACTN|nr:antibiotic biosynthesis monooxygenase [Geodermatophilus saharensis]SNT01278.1 Antibiotic biosynthesis monooxygenase [Geodermatophilus saharensis]